MRRITLISLLLLSSCSATRLHDRAINRGFKHETTTVTDTLETTITINGKDSVVLVPVSVVCPECDTIPPRYYVRALERTKRAEIRNERKETKSDNKTEAKIAKQDTKKVKAEKKIGTFRLVFFCFVFFFVGWFGRSIYGIVN